MIRKEFKEKNTIIKFMNDNKITIPHKCILTLDTLISNQVSVLSSTCIDTKNLSSDLMKKLYQCLELNIDKFDELKQIIIESNRYNKHKFFEKDLIISYLILSYYAIYKDDKNLLIKTLLSYSAYLLSIIFRSFFKVCNPEYMHFALTKMNSKAVYKKFTLNHIDVLKYIVSDVIRVLDRYMHRDDGMYDIFRLISSRIKQNMKTLANAYYKVSKDVKEGYQRSTSQQVQDVNSIVNIFNLNLPIVKQSLVSYANKISKSYTKFECIHNHITESDIRMCFMSLIKNQQFITTMFDSCSQPKKAYNYILNKLMNDPVYLDIFARLRDECNLSNRDSLIVRTYIAYAIILTWKIGVCE